MNPLIALQSNGGFNPLAIESQLADADHKRATTNALMMQERTRAAALQQEEAARQEARQRRAGYNALLARIPESTSMGERANMLIRGGYQKEGLDLMEGASKAGELDARAGKQNAEVGKMSFEQAIKAQEYISQATGALLNDPALDPSKVAQAFRQGVAMGVLPEGRANQQIAHLQTIQNPQQLREFVEMMHNAGKSLQQQAEERKRQTIQTNNGDSNTITSFNPYTGKSEIVANTKINQSPDNLANNTTRINEGAADRAVSSANSQRSAGAMLGAAQMAKEAQATQAFQNPDGTIVLVNKGTKQAVNATDGTGAPIRLANETDVKNKKNAKDIKALLSDAELSLNNATGSVVGYGADQTARLFGKGTKGADATAALKTIEGTLISKLPRLEGPQSDADRKLYKAAAGDLADPTMPISGRKEAIKQIRKIQSQYDENGKWLGALSQKSGGSFKILSVE